MEMVKVKTVRISPEWVDEIVCKFSMEFEHSFTEEELEELVLALVSGLNQKLVEIQ